MPTRTFGSVGALLRAGVIALVTSGALLGTLTTWAYASAASERAQAKKGSPVVSVGALTFP